MDVELDKIRFNINKISDLDNGEKFEITIYVPMSIGWIERMKFITETSNERNAYQLKHLKNEDGYVCFSSIVDLPTKAIYHYYFSFEANHQFIYYKKKNRENIHSINKDDMWSMSVNYKVPDWAKGKMMYHVFVDRFNHGSSKLKAMPHRIIHSSWDEDIMVGADKEGKWNTDFYGGDIRGIIDKLDYISSLGVSILYLSPVVYSQSNHRYDTADYATVDPYAGCNDDLKELCEKAHLKGMKVILDAVFNHTGNDSKYFNEYGNWPNKGAYQGAESEYYDFYKKYQVDNKTYFDYWWGMKNLPVCDGNSKKWQDYIYGKGGIIDLWFSLGIDGLRLDVADELSDSFIEGIRRAVKRNKDDGFILGEVWKNPMRMNRSYIESGIGMDSVMNYQLVNALIRYFKYSDCHLLKEIMKELIVEYPTETLNSLMNFTSTHDITRAINIFGSNEFQFSGEWAWNLNNNDRNWEKNYRLSNEEYLQGKKVYMAYLYTLCFLPGNLSIFYGDEIGMQGMGNLANRRPFTWNNMDNEILEFVRKIGSIRKNEKEMEQSFLEILDITDKYLQFKRINNDEEILVNVNRTNNKVNLLLPKEYRDEKISYSLNNSNKEELDNYGAVVLKKVR